MVQLSTSSSILLSCILWLASRLLIALSIGGHNKSIWKQNISHEGSYDAAVTQLAMLINMFFLVFFLVVLKRYFVLFMFVFLLSV